MPSPVLDFKACAIYGQPRGTLLTVQSLNYT